MKILLLGATGRTGKLIIEEALKRGHQISAIARDPEKLKGFAVDVTQGTPYDYPTVEKAIAGCDVVINTLNVSRKSENPWAPLAAPKDLISKAASNAVAAMKQAGIKRIVAMSTIGAGRSWQKSPWLLKLMVSSSNLKHAFQDHGRQEAILESSDMDYTICRAPMLSLKPGESGAVAAAEDQMPPSPTLSRSAAATFFLDIIENRQFVREVIHVSDAPGKKGQTQK